MQHLLPLVRRFSVTAFVLAALASLVACGGGGSGGGSSAPRKLEVVVPVAGQALVVSDQVEIHFLNEADAVDDGRLSVTVNGVDVSSLFTIDAESATAKASVYALQGILGAQTQSSLAAKITGSRTENVSFTYQGKPELVLKTVSGGTGSGYCEDFDADNAAASVNCPVSGLPLSGDSLMINGLVRNAVLQALSGSSGTAEIQDAGQAFALNGVIFAEENDGNSNDFSWTATASNAQSTQLNLAVPGKLLNNMLALQLHSMDENHVISRWIADVIEIALNTAVAEQTTLMKATGDNDQACELVNNFKDDAAYPTDFTVCDVVLLQLGQRDDISQPVRFSVNASIESKPQGSALDSGWLLKLHVQATTEITAKIRVNAYQGMNGDQPENKQGHIELLADLAGNQTATALLGADFAVTVGAADGADLLAIEVGQEALTIAQYLRTVRSPVCESVCGGSPNFTGVAGIVRPIITDTVDDFAYTMTYCLQPYTYNGGSFNVNDLAACGYSELPEPWMYDYLAFEQPVGQESAYVSVIRTSLEQLSYSSPDDASGFVTARGTHKTRDDGVHVNALGAVFTEPAAASKVTAADMQQAGDASIAVSASWINQLLLSVFQSDVLGQFQFVDQVGDLGDLGDMLIDQSFGLIKATDDVTATVALGSVPSVTFTDGGYAELTLHNVAVSMVLSSDLACINQSIQILPGVTITVNSCAATNSAHPVLPLKEGKYPYLDLVMDIKLRLKPQVGNGNLLTQTGADDLALYISSAEGSVVKVNNTVYFKPDAKELHGMMLPYVADLLDQQLSDLLGAQSFNVTLGNLCDQESALSTALTEFFGTEGRKLTLLADTIEPDVANEQGEAAHMLAGGSIVASDDVQSTDTALVHLSLQYGSYEDCTPP